MDISKYGIRVIRLNKEYYKAPLITSKKRPIDVEGTILKVLFPSVVVNNAMKEGRWFDVFFFNHSTSLYIRWDNDEKGTCPLDALTICSIGTLPMCWPLYAPSRADLAHKFDFRRPEDRCPKTTSNTKSKYDYGKYTPHSFHDLIKHHFNTKDTENTVISTMPKYEANKRSAHAYQYYGVDRSQHYYKQTEPIPQPEAPPETPEDPTPARLAREAQYRENRKYSQASSYDTFFNFAKEVYGVTVDDSDVAINNSTSIIDEVASYRNSYLLDGVDSY
jgi:hypothetical protein